MSGFFIGAAALVAITLAFVLPPLWRTARPVAAAMLVAIPLALWLLYAQWGTPDALDPRNLAAPKTMDEAIAQLERRLQREPDEVQGWLLLGRSRVAQGKFVAAREAFSRAHALLPDDLDVMVEYADAQLRASDNGRFPAGARALLERVVDESPQHQRGLFLLGLQRLQSERAAEAVVLWERLMPQLEPATAEALRAQLESARAQAGLPPGETPASEPATTAGPTLQLRIELAPALQSQLPEGAVLYVFARTTDGAGLPVAVKRLAAQGFPRTITLSDSDGLMPAQKLSMQSQVRVLARVSRSGDAAGASGDLEAEGQLLDVRDGAQATVVIDQVRQ